MFTGAGAAEAERVADRQHPVADPRFGVGKLGEREIGAAGDLDQCKVSARIGADHLRRIGLAIVHRDFDLVGAVDHVVVGHGKTVSRDEEAGTLAGHRATTATGAAAHAGGQAIRSAEALEEALHRRTRLERRVVVLVGAVVLGKLVGDIDLDRNHRRLHALDDVGKADRPLDLADFVVDLRVCRAGEDINRALRAETINGRAEAGDDGSHQGEFARREQRTALCAVGRKRGKIDGTFGHVCKISRARISTVRGAGHLTRLKMGFRALPRAG